jgi:hypothetical protein
MNPIPAVPANAISWTHMKPSHLISFICGVLLTLGVTTIGQSQAQPPNHVYELRMYHTVPGRLDALQRRFRDHTISIFDKHDMKSIGYWVPQDTPELLIYILEHPSRDAATKNWAAFMADPEWVKAKTESEASGKIVDHVDNYFMNPTDYSKLK